MTGWRTHLGAPGWLALLALAAALVLGGWLTPRWQREASALQSGSSGQPDAAAGGAGMPASAAVSGSAPAASPARAASAARPADAGAAIAGALLPAVGDPAARAADLLALALVHGVSAAATQQRLDREGPVRRLRLDMSTRATYADLRGFIAAALQADSGLALDALLLRRVSAAETDVQADLRWSLLQAAPAPGVVPPLDTAPGGGRDAWSPLTPQAMLAWSVGRPVQPRQAAAATAARPVPPAFPYRWIGRLESDGEAQALLAGPLRSIGARVGDVLDNRWLVEGIAAAHLQLTWLPTGETVQVEAR